MVFTARLKEHLKKNDVGPADVTKVLLLFKFCAWCTWFGLIPFCGKFRPLRRLVKLPVIRETYQKLITKYPTQYQRYEEHLMRTSEWFGSRNWVRWIPDTFGQKHKDFGLAVAEATVMYKLTFIMWAPAEFMAIVRWYAKKRRPLSLGDSYTELTQNYKHLIESRLDSYTFLIDPSNEDDDSSDSEDDSDDGKGGSNGGNVSGKTGKAGRSVGGRNASVTAFGCVDYSTMKVPPFSYATAADSEAFRLVSANTSSAPSPNASVSCEFGSSISDCSDLSGFDFDFDFNPERIANVGVVSSDMISPAKYLNGEWYARLLQWQFFPQSSLFGLNLTSFWLYYGHRCFSSDSHLIRRCSGNQSGGDDHSVSSMVAQSQSYSAGLFQFRQLFHSNGIGFGIGYHSVGLASSIIARSFPLGFLL